MFRRVLIANRGEIALRILRSLRAMGVEVVTIHGKEDRLSLPVRLADESVYIPRSDPLASYLDIEAIVSAAKGLVQTQFTLDMDSSLKIQSLLRD